MTGIISLTEFWRVGRKADPLHVDVRYQGAGRFDDPERLVAVLYGAPTIRTCLLEFLLPWSRSPEARLILGSIPSPTEEEEAEDAANDRRIAKEQWQVPTTLYERTAIRVVAEPSIDLLDLREIAVRNLVGATEAVVRELRAAGFSQLDRGALLSPHRALTQCVTGAVLRGHLSNEAIDGMRVESRHAGDVVAIFYGDPYRPSLQIAESVPLTKQHPEVIAIAEELELSV